MKGGEFKSQLYQTATAEDLEQDPLPQLLTGVNDVNVCYCGKGQMAKMQSRH